MHYKGFGRPARREDALCRHESKLQSAFSATRNEHLINGLESPIYQHVDENLEANGSHFSSPHFVAVPKESLSGANSGIP